MITENEVKKMFLGFTDSCSELWKNTENETALETWFNQDSVGIKLFDKITKLESQKDWDSVRKVMEFYYKRLKKKIEDSGW